MATRRNEAARVLALIAGAACSTTPAACSTAPADGTTPVMGDAGSDAFVMRSTGSPQTCARRAKVTATKGTCNGAKELCDRTYDRVVTPMTHNAFSKVGDFAVPNQSLGLERQLADGIRGMMLDVDYWDPIEQKDTLERFPDLSAPDQAYLCHAACVFGRARLLDSLCVLTDFLDQNPEEIVSIIFENRMADEDTEAVLQASGLGEYVYTHPSPEAPWPTLGSMIASGKRLVVFLEQGGGTPPHLHHAWTHVWDTPYTFTSTSEFTCALNRGATTNALFLVNHWLDRGTPERGAEANAASVLGARVETCTREAGRPPTFVGVDFYDRGDLFDVVRKANKL